MPYSFRSEIVEVQGVRYHVQIGGRGPAVLLIHGYAETSQMWFPLIEAWKGRYTLVVPDLKGIGESSVTGSGYDKKTVAVEMKGLLDHYRIESAAVIGHDIGLMVAYAFAAQFPEATRKLVLMDAFLPGIGPGPGIYDSPSIWHFRFNGPYAEKLVEGRERVYFDALWNGFAVHPERFKDAQKSLYARLYARVGRMSAGWEYFKAMPQDAKDNQIFLGRGKLGMPVLSMGGEKSQGLVMEETVKAIAENPASAILPDCGHWMLEECEDRTIEALDGFLKA